MAHNIDVGASKLIIHIGEPEHEQWNKYDYKILQYLLLSLQNNSQNKYTAKVNYKTLRKVIGNIGIRETKTCFKKAFEKVNNLSVDVKLHGCSRVWFRIYSCRYRIHNRNRVSFGEDFLENLWVLSYLRLLAENESDWNYDGSIYTGNMFDDWRCRVEGNHIELQVPPKRYRIKFYTKARERITNANQTQS